MGSDKCYLEYRGKTFLEIQIENGTALGIRDIIVSGSHPSKDNIRVVKDRFIERGPLGGLEACLRTAKNERCVVVCADNPLLTKEALQRLMDLGRNLAGPVIACEHNGKQESLIGIYDTSVADEMQEELINRKGSVFAFLNRIGCKWVNMDEFESCFYNINRPEDYKKINSY